MRSARLGCSVVLVLLAAAVGGCTPSSGCPGAVGTWDSASPPACSPYAGRGNPYLSGPLLVQSLDVAHCLYEAPLPLLIYAPERPGSYPVIVLQHGFISENTAYDEIMAHLAGHGFVVIAPQMYKPSVLNFLGYPTAEDEAVSAADVLAWLPGHLALVLGYQACTARVGLIGHSRGGKVTWLELTANPSAAQALAEIDPVDVAGVPWGKQAEAVHGTLPFTGPVLIIGSGLFSPCTPEGQNHDMFYAASNSPAWHVVVPGHGHVDMMDDDAATTVLGICNGGPERGLMRRLIGGLLVGFFRASLQGDTTAYDYLTPNVATPLPINVETK